MSRYFSLSGALALSIVLHAAVLVLAGRLPSAAKVPRPAESLRVKLVEPAAVAALAQPELLRREDTPRNAVTKPAREPDRPVKAREVRDPAPRLVRPPGPAPAGGPPVARELVGEAARTATRQLSRQLFYPPEAIARGLEGETLVLLFLDAEGNAIAARIEGSSGHALLDNAAVAAARTLRSLPASAPREAVVPVRFRLR